MSLSNLPRDFQAFLSFEGFEKDLLTELKRLGCDVLDQRERLVLATPPPRDPIWAQNIWREPRWISFSTVSEAAKLLKENGPLWANYAFTSHRRSELIQQQIHRFEPKKIKFMSPLPQKCFGAWSLWDEKIILASSKTNSVFPRGEVRFEESKVPPSRAYLKLWEAVTAHNVRVHPHENVVDLGSCPGGWTWVLSQMAKTVLAVDKAPLDESLQNNPRIIYLKKDAFALKPSDVPPQNIVFSDIICEPARLLSLVEVWLEHSEKFVCTIKFKGETDFEIMDRFQQISRSRIVHLYANKHEVTWIRGFEPEKI